MKFGKLLFCFWFRMYTKRTCSQFKYKMGAKHSKSLVYLNSSYMYVLSVYCRIYTGCPNKHGPWELWDDLNIVFDFR